MCEIMGASQGMHEPERICLVGLRIIDPKDRFGPVFQQDEVDLLGDLLIGLFPRDRLKPSLHPFQWGADPIGIIDIMEIPMAPGADHAMVAVGLRVSFDPPDASVFHVSKQGAAIPAPAADGGNAGNGGLGARLGPALEIEEPQGESAGGHCGSLQETPPRYLQRLCLHCFGYDILKDSLLYRMRAPG